MMIPLTTPPHYVIETPRTRNRGHRAIIPSGYAIKPYDVERVVLAASDTPLGSNYIARGEEVTLELSNGTIGSGIEWLILVGVEVRSLSTEQLNTCYQRLERRRADVTRLVEEQINWSQEGRCLLIEREELNLWAQLDELDTLPSRASAILDVHIRTPVDLARSSRWLVIAALYAALLVGVAAGASIALYYSTLYQPRLPTETTPSTPASSLTANQPDDHSSVTRQILEKAASEKTLTACG